MKCRETAYLSKTKYQKRRNRVYVGREGVDGGGVLCVCLCVGKSDVGVRDKVT